MPRVQWDDGWVANTAQPVRWITGAGTGTWTTTGTYTWTVTTANTTAPMYYDYNGWRVVMGADVEQRMYREPERTPEQVEQRRAEAAAWEAGREAREALAAQRRTEQQRQQAEHAERRRVANARAEELLLEILDEAQQATYRERGYIEVVGSAGNRYRIRTSGAISGNVDLMHGPEGDLRVSAYCAHGPGRMPSNDHYIQQLLALETDEAAFRRVANHYSTYADAPPPPITQAAAREMGQRALAAAQPAIDGVTMDEAFGWRDLGYVDEMVLHGPPVPARDRRPTETVRAAAALDDRERHAQAENDRNAPPPPGEGDDGAAVLAVLDGVVVQAGELWRRGALARAP